MKRSKHNLSNYHLTTCDMGKLIPIGLQEALPGDTFQMDSSAVIRVSPLAAPVMHPVNVRIHHFFVPHRLVWTGWEDFITGGPDGNNAASIPIHDIASTTTPAQWKATIFEHYGIPYLNTATGNFQFSQLPTRGYNMIWNEYYRDQDLQTERLETDAGIADIAWAKDYFTSARPWTQKGAAVTLPLGTQAPIKGIGLAATLTTPETNQSAKETGSITRTYARSWPINVSGSQQMEVEEDGTTGFPKIYADLSKAGVLNVNDFRRAFALQRYQEARARYGSRYTEYLRYLGVRPSDARLQRPEFLGGGSARINFSEVLQTSDPQPATPTRESFGVGDMYGHGIAGLRHRRVRRFIEEHGYIHSFLSVRPRAIYQNGLARHFIKKTKEDFWQKELQFIGQQAISGDEIYAKGTGTPAWTFGYQDRYSEYRSTPSKVTGEYRDLLDYWHMARDLPATTTLNADFVKCVPTKRIHNVQTNHALWCMINNRVVARRMVSRNAPGRIL